MRIVAQGICAAVYARHHCLRAINGPRPGFRRAAPGLERVATATPCTRRERRVSEDSGVSGDGVASDSCGNEACSNSADIANAAGSSNTANSASAAIPAPRVAYFPDSFHEVNGVAHTSRHFEAFARRRNLPFLCVRAGGRAQALVEDGNVWTLELPRGMFSFALEKDLRFDPAFARHMPLIEQTLERFQPDLIHVTGPSEVGMM